MKLDVLLWSIILAFAPVSEVRGAIPYLFVASNGDAHLLAVGLALSVLSNMCVPIAAFPILSLLDAAIAKPWAPPAVKRLYAWMRRWGEEKALKVKKGSYIALAIFVAIPLPATGAWTGSLVAHVLGLDRVKSAAAISVGVLVASILVLAATYLGLEALRRLFLL